MDADQLAALLKKYLNNDLTEEERVLVDAWIDQRQEMVFQDRENPDLDLTRQIKEKIDRQIRFNRYKRTAVKSLISMVCIAFCITCVHYWLLNPKQSGTEQFVVYAPKNQKIRIRMVDGSIIILNEESKCSYSKKFGIKDRKVNLLTGEAYFDVAADQHKPFIVETKQSQTKVLGTSFNINTKEIMETVTLTKGKVAVTARESTELSKPLYLNPNEQALIRNRQSPIKRPVDALSASNWSRIYFESQTIAEAVVRLSQVYGIRIEIKNKKLNHIRFSASFNLSDKPTDVIYELAKANDFLYKWNTNRIVTLY